MKILKILAAAALLSPAGPALADSFSNAPGEGGAIPMGAFDAGYEADGQTLYPCVVGYNGGWHPGRIRYGFDGCNFGYGGREITVPVYDVLVP